METPPAPAADALAARAAHAAHGLGNSGAPLVRRPTGTDDRHQDQGRGARDVLSATATGPSSAHSHRRHAVVHAARRERAGDGGARALLAAGEGSSARPGGRRGADPRCPSAADKRRMGQWLPVRLARPSAAGDRCGDSGCPSVVETQGAIAERQGDEAMPQVGEPSALQFRLLQARERVLAELAAAEEEAEESEVMELVEESDESVDRFATGDPCASARLTVGWVRQGVGVHVRAWRTGTPPPSAGVPTLVMALVVLVIGAPPDGAGYKYRAVPGVLCVTYVMNNIVQVTGVTSFGGVDDLAALTAMDCT